MHPGAGLVLPPGVNVRPELPDDMSVDIHREGKKPAEITVKKGKETWKATEDDLSKLPEEIRREVEPLLHDGPVRIWFRELQSSAAPGGAPDANAGQAANGASETSESAVGRPQPPHGHRCGARCKNCATGSRARSATRNGVRTRLMRPLRSANDFALNRGAAFGRATLASAAGSILLGRWRFSAAADAGRRRCWRTDLLPAC